MLTKLLIQNNLLKSLQKTNLKLKTDKVISSVWRSLLNFFLTEVADHQMAEQVLVQALSSMPLKFYHKKAI